MNNLADFIIIDTGAGISDQVLEFVMASPEILLVTTPEPSSLTDSYSLLKALYRNPGFVQGGAKIHVLANKVTSQEEGQSVFDKLNSVVSQFLHGDLDFIGVIPQDEQLERAVRQQKPVSLYAPKAPSTEAYDCLARNLAQGTNEQVRIRWGITQMISNIINKRF